MPGSGHWEADGLHMSKEGYAELGKRLSVPVRELLEGLKAGTDG